MVSWVRAAVALTAVRRGLFLLVLGLVERPLGLGVPGAFTVLGLVLVVGGLVVDHWQRRDARDGRTYL